MVVTPTSVMQPASLIKHLARFVKGAEPGVWDFIRLCGHSTSDIPNSMSPDYPPVGSRPAVRHGLRGNGIIQRTLPLCCGRTGELGQLQPKHKHRSDLTGSLLRQA
jgi:hypothetical protein